MHVGSGRLFLCKFSEARSHTNEQAGFRNKFCSRLPQSKIGYSTKFLAKFLGEDYFLGLSWGSKRKELNRYAVDDDQKMMTHRQLREDDLKKRKNLILNQPITLKSGVTTITFTRTAADGIQTGTTVMTEETMKELGMMSCLFKWIDRHERLTTAILWLEAIAMMWVVLNYDFTTNI